MINIILLDKNNNYVMQDGKLPTARPEFDKPLLAGICKGAVVSEAGYNLLPPSMQARVYITNIPSKITLGLTIPEINELSDVLIIVRANSRGVGKKFRLDNFKLLTKQGALEICTRI